MLIGYARVSKADGSQSLDLQRDALVAAGVGPDGIYEDRTSGAKEDRLGLEACLRALRHGDVVETLETYRDVPGRIDFRENYPHAIRVDYVES